MQPGCRFKVEFLHRLWKVELEVLVNVAEFAIAAVELCFQAFGNVAAVVMITPLDKGRVSDLKLLLIDENVSDCDISAVDLAERSDAICISLVEVMPEVVLTRDSAKDKAGHIGVLLRSGNVQGELFAWLMAHDCLVVDRNLNFRTI